ncbi:hypothetical protein BaRGS_00023691 [Batillaria attramentaria]|uniref:Uncharacterized protein n=1 Tax=Batillaria attramentaria TaxID=370345 RepID=A0ABD0KDD2_9CAEN
MESEPKPSQTYDEYWLWEMKFLNMRLNVYPRSESGKWMTFHALGPDLDAAWNRAKHLYRTGQLPEIKSMKVGTAAPNPAYADKSQDTKVICFYCGPASDKQKMLAIGRQVAEKMDYQAGHIAYKTDDMTRSGVSGCVYKIYRSN